MDNREQKKKQYTAYYHISDIDPVFNEIEVTAGCRDKKWGDVKYSFKLHTPQIPQRCI
jgi:hypothetical protein